MNTPSNTTNHNTTNENDSNTLKLNAKRQTQKKLTKELQTPAYSHISILYKSIIKKQIRQDKHSDPRHLTVIKLGLLNKFSSPTDNLLSPCSQKLNSHKSNIFKIRAAKPTKLTFVTDDSLMMD